MPTNLLGEYYDEPVVDIKDNEYLARLSNQILDLKKKYPNLFDGDTIGEINRKVMLAVWLDNGLEREITDRALLKSLIEWLKNTKIAISEENTSRAVRYLASRDLIRLPA